MLIRIPALKQILVWMPTIAREMKFASTKVLTMVLSKVTANLLSVQTSSLLSNSSLKLPRSTIKKLLRPRILTNVLSKHFNATRLVIVRKRKRSA